MIKLQNIDAGDFATWVANTTAVQTKGAEADVPCGECNGCCRSFYFIHVTPEDTRALAAIPKALLFPAPGLSAGNFVMGYNDQGHCPMLVEDRCSIYFDRPQTCRAYDCRVFAAAEMPPGEQDKVAVKARTERWSFRFASDIDRIQQQSVARAAAWLAAERDNAASHLPAEFVPSTSTQLAMLALQLHHLFDAATPDDQLLSPAHARACVTAVNA